MKEDLISSIEKQYKTLAYDYDFIVPLKKGIEETGELSEIERFETLALEFSLRDGEAQSSFIAGDYHHPTYEKLTKSGLDYLKRRVEESANIFLIARYNQVIYNSKKGKHHKYLNGAIDGYLKVLAFLISNEDFDAHNDLVLTFNNLTFLGKNAKSNHERIRQSLDRILESSEIPIQVKKMALLAMLDCKPIFKSTHLKKHLGVWGEIYSKIKSKDGVVEAYRYSEVGLEIAKRTNTSLAFWNTEIGDYYRERTNEMLELEKREMIALEFCDKSIRAYKNAKNFDRVTEMRKLRSQIRNDFELPTINLEIEVDKDEVLNKLELKEALIKKLLALEGAMLFRDMTGGFGVFPSIDAITSIVKKGKRFWLDLLNTSYYDTNNNIVARDGDDKSEEAKKVREFYQYYSLFIQTITLPSLNEVFIVGIVKEKISYQSLMEYFVTSSWLGKVRVHSSRKTTSTWASMIAPGIADYISNVQYSQTYKDYNNIPILALDSLVTKFEGAFRHLCYIQGIIITTETKEGQREKYIHELLFEEEVLEVFGKDDIIFFRYVYTRNGLNLRNRIAHSFMVLEDYNLSAVHLVVMSFLRLARYDVVPRKE